MSATETLIYRACSDIKERIAYYHQSCRKRCNAEYGWPLMTQEELDAHHAALYDESGNMRHGFKEKILEVLAKVDFDIRYSPESRGKT